MSPDILIGCHLFDSTMYMYWWKICFSNYVELRRL